MKNNFYVTIGRQMGAGGLSIGHKLSRVLSVPCYNNSILEKASQESGINLEFFEKADEVISQKFSSGYIGINFSSLFSDIFASTAIDNTELFKVQSNAIRKLAQSGSSIFVGRCADYILREERNILSVFITATLEDRIDRIRKSGRISDIDKMSDSHIADMLEKADKKRAEYYNYFTFKEWGKASSYHICLDSSRISEDKCVDIIANLPLINSLI